MTAASRRRGPTFRARLTLGMTVLSLAVLAVASTGVYVWARTELLDAFDSLLVTVAQVEVEAATDDPDGSIHLHEGTPVPLPPGMGPAHDKVVRIRSEDGTVNLRTPERGMRLATDPAREAQALAGTASLGDAHRGREIFRAIYYPFRDAKGRKLFAVVAISTRPLERTLWSLVGALGVCLAAGGVAAGWGANRLARHLTRPLDRIAEGARAVGDGRLGARIPEVSRDVELREVTAVLNEMLERLEGAVQTERRFLADASHELRSPLANVRGTIEVALRRARSGDEYRETLAIALTEVERLSRLVSDLLTLSRADAGHLSLTVMPCPLPALAEDAIRVHTPRAAERDLHLSLEAPDAVEVLGDVDRLRSVIDNLLDNALHYAPPGSTVVVRAHRDGEFGRLSVQDAGPGLSPEEQRHVFDRFYRADRSRARHSGGTGLGLAIAKAVVDAHHGRLWVESAPGQGCTFSVELPVAVPDKAGHESR